MRLCMLLDMQIWVLPVWLKVSPGSTKVNSFCEMSCQRLTRFKVIYLQREDEKERGAVGVLLTNPK